jgi:3',5'-cyclic AMP phosphodiesterase CpdA
MLGVYGGREMPRPFLLAQLTDPHIGASFAGGDATTGLAAAVDELRRLPDRADAVVVTGDLADSGADQEYQLLRSLLLRLEVPVYVLPGNHDSRDVLRRHFDLPGGPGAPVQYTVDLGPARLVVIDTTRPGEVSGELDAQRLAWLDAELGAAPDRTTLVAMHHPPVAIGIDAWDEIGLPRADRHALRKVLERHPQVRRLVAGHVHQTITGDLDGRVVLMVPGTYAHARLDFSSDKLEFLAAPPGFALHAVADSEIVSHIKQLDA